MTSHTYNLGGALPPFLESWGGSSPPPFRRHCHAAYSALTHGLSSRWRYVFRTVPNISVLLQPLEDVIRCTFLPAVLGISPPNDAIRSLLALPPRWGAWECLIQLCNVFWNTLLLWT